MPVEKRAYDEFLERVSSYGFGISTSSSIPLYYQLYLILQRAIRDHALAPGDRFPAEEAIAAHFAVSRPTANRAVQELIKRGWVARQRGRGTFVQDVAPTQLSLLNNSLSFSDEIGRRDDHKTRFVVRTTVAATAEDAVALSADEGDELCYIRRLHKVGGRIVMVCDSKLPSRRFPGLESTPFIEQSLFKTLREKFDCTVVQAERCAEAAEILDSEVAELLDVPLFAPILLLTGLAFDEQRRPIEAMTAYVREGVSFKNLIVADATQGMLHSEREMCPRTHAPSDELG
jgi:GntR family transcriptional regulator